MIKIVTKTYYPTKATQTSGGKYRTFKDLNVIKATNNGYSESSGDIQSKKKSPNRPSTITLTGFNTKLPVGAVVNSIKIEIKHLKTGESNKKSCNIGAPTISLIYNNKIINTTTTGDVAIPFTYSKKAQAPTMVASQPSVTFNGKSSTTVVTGGVIGGTTTNGIISQSGITTSNKASVKTKKLNTYYDLPTRVQVNDSSFGVQINYPTNTNTYTGKIRIYWVRLIVEYTLSAYTVKMTQINNDDWGYNGEEYHVKLSVSRTSKTGYVPYVTVTTPLGFSYKGTRQPDTNLITLDNTGTVELVSSNVLKYTPALSKKNEVSTASVELVFDVNVIYANNASSYTGTFTAVESLNDSTGTLNATITDRPAPVVVDENEPLPLDDIIITNEEIESPVEWIDIEVGQEIKLIGEDLEDTGAINGELYYYFKIYDENDNDISNHFLINGTLASVAQFRIGSEVQEFILTPLDYVASHCRVEPHLYERSIYVGG